MSAEEAVRRARVAAENVARHRLAMEEWATVRHDAVREMLASGMSYTEAADALGVSRGMIQKLARGKAEAGVSAGP